MELVSAGKRRWRSANGLDDDSISAIAPLHAALSAADPPARLPSHQAWSVVEKAIEDAIGRLAADRFRLAALDSFGYTDHGGFGTGVNTRDDLAARHFQPEATSGSWYRKPNRKFGGQKPRDFTAGLVAASLHGVSEPERFLREYVGRQADSDGSSVPQSPPEPPSNVSGSAPMTSPIQLENAWLERAEALTDREYPALRLAQQRSMNVLELAQARLRDQLAAHDEHPLGIVVCGSLARDELSQRSDFDYLIVAHGLVQPAKTFRQYRLACDEFAQKQGLERPGDTGLFGQVVSAVDLVDRIGLEQDGNTSTTRRVLLLEEARAVLRPDLHEEFVRVALDRYLSDEAVQPDSVPRFLLNDLCRYWRMIAVDYQAKAWARLDTANWALRYLKLRVSRKLTFAGSLVPLLAVPAHEPPSTKRDLRERLVQTYVALPPLGRLAQLAEFFPGDEVVRTTVRDLLVAADRFNALAAKEDWRKELEELPSREGAQRSPAFRQGNEIAEDVARALERLLFDSAALSAQSRKYLVF